MNRDLALWSSVLGGPLVWLSSFEAKFALAPWACIFQTKLALYIVSLLALALCAGCAMLGVREWQALGKQSPDERAGAIPRSVFMAVGGIVLSAGSFLIILAQIIPDIGLGACQ
jgi:hypothetical protein